MAWLSCLEPNTEDKMLLASEKSTHYSIPQAYRALLTIKIHFYSSIGITHKLLQQDNKRHALSPWWFSTPQQHQSFYVSTLPRRSNLTGFSHTQLPGFQSPLVLLRCFGLHTGTSGCKFLATDSSSRTSSNHTGLSVPSAWCGIAPAVAWPQHPTHKPTLEANRWATVTITEATFSRCLLYYLLRLRFYVQL